MAYETVLTLHIISFIWNISLVVLADGVGLLWVFGKVKKLPKKFMVWAHKLIWVGLTASIITGATMFWDLRDYLLTVPAFYTKVLFVLALMINAFLISRHLHVALEAESFSSLDSKHKKSFFISGLVSTVGWITVVISATQLGL